MKVYMILGIFLLLGVAGCNSCVQMNNNCCNEGLCNAAECMCEEGTSPKFIGCSKDCMAECTCEKTPCETHEECKQDFDCSWYENTGLSLNPTCIDGFCMCKCGSYTPEGEFIEQFNCD